MSLRSRIADAFAALAGKQRTTYPPVGRVPDLAEWIIGQPWMMTEQQLTHVDAFKKVPIVNSVVSLIAEDCAALPKRFYLGTGEKRKEIERKPGNIVDVWSGANTRDTGLQLAIDLHSEFDLHGNAYLYLERGKGAGPTVPPYAVWSMKATQVEPVPGPGRRPDAYLWNRGGYREEMKPHRVIHFARYNPVDEPVGISWLEAAKENYEAQYYALLLLKQFFKSGGLTPGIYGFQQDSKLANMTQPLKDEEIKAIRERFRRLFQGAGQGITGMIILDQLELLMQGQKISELQLDKMLAILDAQVCRLARVPPRELGISDTDQLGQGKPNEISAETYWYRTIGRRVRLFDSILNERFCPLYGEGITVETDMSAVPALMKARLEMMKAGKEASGTPNYTVNEIRGFNGDEPRPEPEADELYTKPLIDPIAAAEAQAQQAEPAGGKTVEKPKKVEEARTAASAPVALDRETRRRRGDADLRRYERKVEAWWNERFRRQLEAAVSRMDSATASLRPGTYTVDQLTAAIGSARFVLDPDSVFPTPDPADVDALAQLFARLILERGEAAAAEIGLEITLDALKERIATLTGAKAGLLIQQVDDTTRDLVAKALADGSRAGEPFSELVARVRSIFESAFQGGPDQQSRAMRIAQTETTWAYNYGAWESWKMAGVAHKEWWSVQDEAVRDSHRACEEQGAIPIDQAFVNGLQYPGEPGGAAAETVGCRCVLQPVVEPVETVKNWWDGTVTVLRRPVNRIAAYVNGHRNGVAA